VRTLISLATFLILAAGISRAAEPTGIIVQFNGKQAGAAKADTRDKEFKPVFEKDLKDIAARLPGKPELTVSSWFTIINGGAVKWAKAEKEMPEKLKAELEKLPYVKMVEYDLPVAPPVRP
jgi:hypothetical protein